MSIRVVLVDDQKLIREGIKSLLSLTDKVTVVGEFSDGSELIEKIETVKCDVILLDLSMPGMDGITALKELKALNCKIPALVLTTFDDYQLVLNSLHNGAQGFLLKDVSLETLIEAIETLAQGDTYVQPAITQNLLTRSKSMTSTFDAPKMLEDLSPKEIEVLRLVACGYSNKEIADALHKSEGTIKNHVSNILSKFGVRDRTRAVLLAIEKGILS